jgi:hypothetical protein
MTTNTTDRAGRVRNSSSAAQEPASPSPTQSDSFYFHPETGEIIEEPTLRDELSAVDGGSSAQAHPLFNIATEEVARLTNLKRGSIHVAQSLALSHELDQAETAAEIFSCADHLRQTPNGYRSLRRCKSRVCAHCAHVESIKATARLRSAIAILRERGWQLRDESSVGVHLDRQLVALKLTVNSGEAAPLDEIRERVDLLHKLLPRLARLAAYRDEVVGLMRSTEVTEVFPTPEEPSRAHVHIHGFLLLRASADIDAIKRSILSYWPKALKAQYQKLNKQVDTTASIMWSWMEPLTTQTADDLASWGAYITKGSYDLGRAEKRLAHQSTSPEYWAAVEREMRSVRLVEYGGELRSAVSEAKQRHKQNKSAARGGRVSTKRQPGDLIFNHLLRDYIRAEHLNDRINPHAFTSSLTHLRSIPHFAALWRAEQVSFENRLADAKRAALWRALALKSFHADIVTVESKSEISFLITEQGQAERPREAAEPERRSPPRRGAPYDPRRQPNGDETC